MPKTGELVIRLARFGSKRGPMYKIFVAQKHRHVQKSHIDVLGYFNPHLTQDGNRQLGLKFDKLRYWLAQGAVPSERLEWLLHVAGVLPEPAQRNYLAHNPDFLGKSKEEISTLVKKMKQGQ